MMCLLWAGWRVVIRPDVEKRSRVLIEQARMSASTASLKRPFLMASVPRCDSLDPTMMRDMKNEAVAFLSFVWMPAARRHRRKVLKYGRDQVKEIASASASAAVRSRQPARNQNQAGAEFCTLAVSGMVSFVRLYDWLITLVVRMQRCKCLFTQA